jgi:hypothetical protein
MRPSLQTLVVVAVVGLCGCATVPTDRSTNTLQPDFLLDIIGDLREQGLVARRFDDCANTFVMRFCATEGKLTLGRAPNLDADRQTQLKRHFKELLKAAAGLKENGLRVRDFEFVSSKNHALEFCNGKLTIFLPENTPQCKRRPRGDHPHHKGRVCCR